MVRISNQSLVFRLDSEPSVSSKSLGEVVVDGAGRITG